MITIEVDFAWEADDLGIKTQLYRSVYRRFTLHIQTVTGPCLGDMYYLSPTEFHETNEIGGILWCGCVQIMSVPTF